MRLVDLSQPIFDAGPNCPAHPPVRSEVTSDHARGAWRWETLTLASHTGQVAFPGGRLDPLAGASRDDDAHLGAERCLIAHREDGRRVRGLPRISDD